MLRILLKLSVLVASSWTLSWCLYRLRGIGLVGPPSEPVWYFAYGANMHDSVFRGWRGIRPLEWRPASSRRSEPTPTRSSRAMVLILVHGG